MEARPPRVATTPAPVSKVLRRPSSGSQANTSPCPLIFTTVMWTVSTAPASSRSQAGCSDSQPPATASRLSDILPPPLVLHVCRQAQLVLMLDGDVGDDPQGLRQFYGV